MLKRLLVLFRLRKRKPIGVLVGCIKFRDHALRAVPDHPKFAELKALLRQPKGPVAGWLEMTWHFTGRFTPQGNIGKYSDTAIESWVEWNGDPGALIEALVQSGWLDRDPVHRLLVHDWHQHADKATKNALMRAKMDFCTPTVRTDAQASTYVNTPQNVTTMESVCTYKDPESGTASRLPVPVPVPVPEPVPEPVPVTPTERFSLPSWVPEKTWNDYLAMRKRIRKPATDEAIKLAVETLERLRAAGDDPRLVLEQSILNSWQGVFGLKVKSATTKRPDTSRPTDAWMSGGANGMTLEECRAIEARRAADGLPILPDLKSYIRDLEGKSA